MIRNRKRPASQERLPPHSAEAETGVLGCCLLDATGQTLRTARERLRPDWQGEEFYDLRHRTIWQTLCNLQDEFVPIDTITLAQRLKDHGNLEGVGGAAFVSALADAASVSLNLPYYLEILIEKFTVRRAIRGCMDFVSRVYEFEGAGQALIEKLELEVATIRLIGRDPALQPKHLVAPREFAEDASARFFRSVELGEPGWLLPIDFRLRIRRKETTMVIGDDKTGKSTLVNYFLLHLAQQGAKCCIASMEMPPPVTLYNLAAQLLGTAHLPECQASLNLLARAMAWLNERFLFYSFLGIAQWRDLLETFRYAAEKDAVNCFEIDSLMRIGIPDDDYAQQGFAAEAFASFAMQTDSHLFYVCHENKSDGKGKKKARGSALWTANACNVLRIERNEDKQIKIDEKHGDIISEKNSTKPDQEWIAECETKIEELRKQWDTRLVLLGQRYPFSQQNAAKRIWFDRSCGQFREHFEDAPVNWLERWKRREKVEAE